MKKFIFTATFALISLFSTHSQTMTVLEGGHNYGGFMPECISPNGKYIGGSTFVEAIFMSEWQQQATEVPMRGDNLIGGEVRSVNDSGIGVGYGGGFNVWNFNTGEMKSLRAGENEYGIRGGMADGINEAGNIIVGVGMDQHYNAYAVYWEDEVMHVLPVPTDAEVGFRTWGSRAQFISQDGNVIVGRLVDDLSSYPMIYWLRQEDGSYKCYPVCAEWYGSGNDKQFRWFEAKSLSPDGKKVAMKLMYGTPSTSDPLFSKFFLGIYDLETGELQVAKPDGKHGIAWGENFDMFLHGISNDGTCVGWFYDQIWDRHSFIMYPDEMQPTSFPLAFPDLEEVAFYDSNGDMAPSSISADGRYIAGMGWTNSELIFHGFVIDTKGEAAVERIENEQSRAKGVYNLQGVKVADSLEGVAKGIYIVGGKKVAVK